jgi:predicted O-methyltransferase YrrM
MKKPFVLIVCAICCAGSLFGTSPSRGSLDEYLAAQGSCVTEGHIGKYPEKLKFFASLFRDATKIRTIGEIGFNAGHSSDLFLSTYPSCTVVSFDIMDHPYATIGKRYIDQQYPGRHSLIPGDSQQTVSEFYQSHPTVRFDLIFIDGGHSFPIAYSDIVHMQRLASPSTIIVVDDINYPTVARAWKACVREGRVREIKRHSARDSAWIQGVYVFHP